MQAEPKNEPDETLVQTGGAVLGILRANWPLATLTATWEGLRISCLWRDCYFPKSHIRFLRTISGFYTGVQIDQFGCSAPEYVVFRVAPFFRPSSFKKFKAKLEALGYGPWY